MGLYSGLKSSDPVCVLYCFSSNIDPFMASPPQMKATRILSVALPQIEEETEGNGWMQSPHSSPLLQLYYRTIEEEMCRLMILIHSTGTVCCFLSDGPQSFQNQNPNLLQLWFHVCMFCICTCALVRLSRFTLPVKVAALHQSSRQLISRSQSRSADTRWLVCIYKLQGLFHRHPCVYLRVCNICSIISACCCLFLYWLCHNSCLRWRVWGVILMSSFSIVYHIHLTQRRGE